MAVITYRGNLKAASFPFLSELFGRSIIVKGPDQNFVGGLAAKESLDSSVGVPQIYYCHNVIPTDAGYRSIGYAQYAAAAFAAAVGFNAAVTIRDANGNSAQLATSAVGNVYVMEAGATTWTIPAGAPVVPGKRVTVALVSGVTYIYFANTGCYIYNWAANTLTLTALAGIVAANVIGVSGNAGYLLVYSETEVLWSSTIDATDFVPSLVTGAGGGSVEGARGKLVTIEEVYGGMIVFAEANAVSAAYSGNPRYPYNFVPITGAGGLTDPNYVSQDTGTGSIYAYTTSGLQLVTLRQATTPFPEITDFLSGALLEDFDEVTNEFSLVDASGSQLVKRIALVADRYLIISYGVSDLTHALYYDIAYKQFGRLKVSHTDCFEFLAYSSGTTEVPKRSIAFLEATGGIKILESDIVPSASSAGGVLIVGKFQYARSRLLQLEGVEFENVNTADTFNLYDMPSLDGKTFLTPVAGYLSSSSSKLRKYRFHSTALNHSVLAIGAFNAVSLLLNFTVAGSR